MNPESSFVVTGDFRTMLECHTSVSVNKVTSEKESLLRRDIEISAKDIILHHCKQKEVLPFEEHFNERQLIVTTKF